MTLVISTLAAGGAERVLALLASGWAEQGAEVTLVTLDSVENDFFAVHPRVQRVGLGVTRVSRGLVDALRGNLARIRILRRAIRESRPDVVVSFTDTVNATTLLATRGLRVPVVVSERIDPRHQPISRLWAGLRRLLYPRADAVVVQTDAVRRWAVRFVAAERVHTIHNPVVLMEEHSGDLRELAGLPDLGNAPVVVAMGRLVEQKGFDLLLRAFAECRDDFPEWRLVILGEGPLRVPLTQLAGTLGISDRASLPGAVRNPQRILCRADLFVLSSHFEGFPNALLEAMACGVAVVATDCASGPRDIITPGVDGMLVPSGDVASLSQAMRNLMADPVGRARLGERACEVRDRFSLSEIMEQWDVLIGQLSDRSSRKASTASLP